MYTDEDATVGCWLSSLLSPSRLRDLIIPALFLFLLLLSPLAKLGVVHWDTQKEKEEGEEAGRSDR